MKKWDRIAAATLTLLGIGAAIESLQIGFGTFQFPGPGFYPFWLAIILAVVSLFYFLTHLGAEPNPVQLWDKQTWVRPLLAVIIMFCYVLFLGWLGFCTATFLLFAAWLIIVEKEK